MKILGIDPGYAILGYGVIEKIGNKFKVCRYGAVTTDAETPMTERLEYLYDSLREIIDENHPDVASIEELFFNTNAKTAILVGTGQRRGDAGLCERRTGNRGIYTAADQAGACGIRQGGQKTGADHGENHPEPEGNTETGRYGRCAGGSHMPWSFGGYEKET